MTEMVYGTVVPQPNEAILPRWWRTVDKPTIVAILLLFAIGLLLGFAASPPLAERTGKDPFFYVERQALYGCVAFTLMFVLSMQPPETARRFALTLLALALLGLLALPFVGTNLGKGAVRWLALPGMTLQPVEFVKPGMLVFSAWLIAASYDPKGPPGKLASFAVTLVVVGLLALQPDFGQASLVLAGWLVLFYLSGASIVPLVLVLGLAAAGGFMAYGMSDHFAGRIDGYFAAEVDPRSQIGYATDAIRSGGFFGAGLGEGSVKWTLPDAHTDFIIAVAAEEYGFFAVSVILGLFAFIVARSLLRLRAERDIFIRLAGAGLVLMFGAQAFINMGVAVRLLPTKGMTLPFISNGGSSLVASGIAMGLVLAFTRTRPRGDIEDIFQRRQARR